MKSFSVKVAFVLVLVFSVKLCTSVTEEESKGKFKEQFAIEGSSYKMKCVGPAGNLSETHYIVWAINGKPPSRGQKYKILTDGLVIRNVSKEDTLQNYTCSALDRLAFIPVYSEMIKLRLRQREGKALEPAGFVRTIIGEKVKVWGVPNQSKTLHCRMYSRPTPTFEWRDSANVKLANSSLYKIVDDDHSSNLTIQIINGSQFQEYSCKAQNPLGESTQIFILAEGYKPKSPFLLPTFISRNRVTLRVELKEDAEKEALLPVTNYLIQYATVDTVRSRKKWNTISRAVDAQGNAGSQNLRDEEIFELLGLQENTTYLVRAAVMNAAATGNFSPSIRITTDTERRPVYVRKEDRKREEYARSSDHGQSSGPRGPDPDAENVDVNTKNKGIACEPKYKKTVIITTISTTLFENMLGDVESDKGKETGGNEKNVLRKRVEEDTKVEKTTVCSMN